MHFLRNTAGSGSGILHVRSQHWQISGSFTWKSSGKEVTFCIKPPEQLCLQQIRKHLLQETNRTMPSQGTNTTSPANEAVIVETLMNIAGCWLSTPGRCQGSASCSRVQWNPPLRAPHLRRARRRSETSSAARPLRTQHFVLLEAEFEEILCPYWNLRADFTQ